MKSLLLFAALAVGQAVGQGTWNKDHFEINIPIQEGSHDGCISVTDYGQGKLYFWQLDMQCSFDSKWEWLPITTRPHPRLRLEPAGDEMFVGPRNGPCSYGTCNGIMDVTASVWWWGNFDNAICFGRKTFFDCDPFNATTRHPRLPEPKPESAVKRFCHSCTTISKDKQYSVNTPILLGPFYYNGGGVACYAFNSDGTCALTLVNSIVTHNCKVQHNMMTCSPVPGPRLPIPEGLR